LQVLAFLLVFAIVLPIQKLRRARNDHDVGSRIAVSYGGAIGTTLGSAESTLRHRWQSTDLNTITTQFRRVHSRADSIANRAACRCIGLVIQVPHQGCMTERMSARNKITSRSTRERVAARRDFF